MTANPLDIHDPAREQRIRETAYHLWEKDGRPEGREQEFWERARELVGMEESPGAGLLPNPATHPTMATGQPEGVEEASLQENLGEFPDRFADQGEWQQTPLPRPKKKSDKKGKKKSLESKSQHSPAKPPGSH